MPRPKKEVVDQVEISTPVEKPVEKEAVKEIEYPEVAGTGRFEAVKVKGGYVLYNPCGQRSSDLLEERKALDLARIQNRAAQIKIKPKE